MSAIPHLSNAYHSRKLRTAIEQEMKQERPPTGGTLTSLADAVKSVRMPIGIELGDKLISINKMNIASPMSAFLASKN